MKPSAFSYVRPGTVAETVAYLATGNARVLAGGQSLVPLMNLRLTAPETIVDINRVDGLDWISERDGSVVIGATVRQATALADDLVRAKAPLVAAALAKVAHVQVRTRGTVVGNLAHHDPASELPAVAVALDAEFTIARAGATRRVPAAEFFVKEFTTVVEPAELVTEVAFPVAPSGTAAAFHEITRKAKDWPLMGAGAQLTVHDGEIVAARVAVCGVCGTPVRQSAVEAALIGHPLATHTLDTAAVMAQADVVAEINARSGAEYRRRVLPVVVRRALAEAAAAVSPRVQEGAA